MLKIPGWQIQQKSIVHVVTGTTIIFEGLRYNTNRIKSMEAIDICWVEEAESVTKDSWEILIPTIRKEGSEIWISFNPDLEEDATYQRFVANEPPNAFVQKVGWEDNPWFFETEMPEEKDYLYRVDPEAADHVWGGYPKKHADAQILQGKWRVEAFEPDPKDQAWAGPFYGSDFGYSVDPTAAVELWIHRKPGQPQGTLYVRRESYKIKLDIEFIQRTWTLAFGRYFPQRPVKADGSRPETINYLKRHGIRRITAAYKWPGSVEDGIAYLRAFEAIVIHPDCPHYKEECRLYSYKVEANTGEVLPKIVDKHNHLIDATRYALVSMIRLRRGTTSGYGGQSYATA